MTKRAWQSWSLETWNQELLTFFFSAFDGDFSPVRRLVVTHEELALVTGDEEASEEEVLLALRRVVDPSYSLLVSAKRKLDDLGWTVDSTEVPPFVFHLVLTCIAASVVDDVQLDEGVFRNRLGELTNQGPTQNLRLLPRLWKDLAAWLANCRNAGADYRLLVLPDPRWETQIGHSKRLAFPPLKDYRTLLALLHDQGLAGAEPPISESIQAMLNARASFSEQFIAALDKLRQQWADGEDVGASPLWSAVRSAALRERSHPAANLADDWRLVAEHDEYRQALRLLGRRAFNQSPFESREFSHLGEHKHALTVSAAEGRDEFEEAAFRVLTNDPDGPEIPSLRRAVRDGLLLFEWDLEFWSLVYRMPQMESVWALVRADLADAFTQALRDGTDFPCPDIWVRASRLPGWVEVAGIRAQALRAVDFDGFDALAHIRVLQRVARPPRVRLAGGLKLGTKRFLGLRGLLPEVHVDHASQVVIETEQGELPLTTAGLRIWQFPRDWEPEDAAELSVTAQTSVGPLRTSVRFENLVMTHAYKLPEDLRRWRCEGSTSPSADFASAADVGLLRIATVDEISFDWSELYGPIETSVQKARAPQSNQVQRLEHAIAATAIRRTGLAEGELLDLFRTVLEPGRSTELWSIVRAWRERGVLVRLSDKRWRGAHYFAVPPRLVQYRLDNLVGVSLMGLATESLRSRFDSAIKNLDGRIATRTPSPSARIPNIVSAVLPDATAVATLSEYLDLGVPLWLRPPEDLVAPVAHGHETLDEMPSNYPKHSLWNWRGGYLDDQGDAPEHLFHGVKVRHHRRADAPDVWVVENGDREWWSYSRTWSLLRGYWSSDGFPFESKSDRELSRRPGRVVHLPIGVGNLIAALGGGSGPSETDVTREYAYQFPSAQLLTRVRALLGELELSPRVAGTRPLGVHEAYDTQTVDVSPVEQLRDSKRAPEVEAYIEDVVWPALGDQVRAAVEVLDDADAALRLRGSSGDLDIMLSAVGTKEKEGELHIADVYNAVAEQDRLRRHVLGDSTLHPLLREGIIRPHALQREALDALEKLRKAGERKALVVMATGLGKTILSALDAKRVGGRILFIVHNNTILEQARVAFRRVFPKASMGLMNGAERRPNADIVFANISTLRLSYHRERFRSNEFNYIIYDEFHHVATTHSATVLAHFQPKFFLGMTATPNRTDQRSLLGFVDGNLAYQATQHDGIRRGYLSPFKYFALRDNIDYSKIKHTGVRYNAVDLNRHLIVKERDQAIIREFKARASDAPAIAFCVSIAHADRAARHFNDAGISAVAVHSGLSYHERETVIRGFRDGAYRVAMVRDLFNEGVDFPAVETLIFMRPTESKIIFTQQLGRGLRVAAGKRHVQVLDFIGNYFNAHRVVDFLSESSAHKITWDRLRGRAKLELDLGVEISFDATVVRELSLLDQGIDSETDVVQAYYRLTTKLGRPPRLVDINHDSELGVRRVLRTFRTWARFVSRLESLGEDIGTLQWPSEYAQMSIDEIVEWSDSDSGVARLLVEEIVERFDLVVEAFNEVLLKPMDWRTRALTQSLPNLRDEMQRVLSPLRDLQFVLQFADIDDAQSRTSKSSKEFDGKAFSKVLAEISNHRDALTLGPRLATTLSKGSVMQHMLSRSLKSEFAIGTTQREQLSWFSTRLAGHVDEVETVIVTS